MGDRAMSIREGERSGANLSSAVGLHSYRYATQCDQYGNGSTGICVVDRVSTLEEVTAENVHSSPHAESAQFRGRVLNLWVIIPPVMFCFPTMFFSVPTPMVLIPASLPLGIEISPPILCRMTALAVIVDCLLQFRLRLFDRMLALRSVVCMGARRCHEKQECHCGYGSYCQPFKS
jgi:hypothetical protein